MLATDAPGGTRRWRDFHSQNAGALESLIISNAECQNTWEGRNPDLVCVGGNWVRCVKYRNEYMSASP